MNEEMPLVCKKCHSPVDETDNFCRVCGKNLRKGSSFMFTHTGIIIMALVAGPFALPCVWYSKVISPTAKWIYTAILGVFTYYLAVVSVRAFHMVNESVNALSSGMLSF